MSFCASPPALPTTRPPAPSVRSDRFRRMLQSTRQPESMRATGDTVDTQIDVSTVWPWSTPPSPVDFDRAAARRTSRTRAVRRYVQQAKTKAASNNGRPFKVDAWPTLSPVTYDPPPATQAEREYQKLRQRHDTATARLKTLYADVHLRMYLLGLLRPSDYSTFGLDGTLDAWVEELCGSANKYDKSSRSSSSI